MLAQKIPLDTSLNQKRHASQPKSSTSLACRIILMVALDGLKKLLTTWKIPLSFG